MRREKEKRESRMRKGIAWIRENPHSWFMAYWLFYLSAFFGLELRQGDYYLIQCPSDNKIPFAEEFVLFYLSWFVLLAGAQFWSLFKSKRDFLRLVFVMFLGNTICLGIYWIAPNGITLRPDTVPDNVWGWMVGLLYQADTPTNVCPSIHVSSSVAIALTGGSSELLKGKKWLKVLLAVWAILICISTLFIKQHSVVDVFWGAIISLALYGILWLLENRTQALDFPLKSDIMRLIE